MALLMAALTGRLRGWLADVAWRLARLGQAGGGRAIGMPAIWLGWERLDLWWTTHRYGLPYAQPGSITRYAPKTYAGPPLVLRDGALVRPGDRILELHLDNRALLQLATSRQWPPWIALRQFAEDLDALARRVRDGEFEGVAGIRALTLLTVPARRLGFEVRPLPCTWGPRLLHFYLVGLVAIYHPYGWRGAAYMRQAAWPGEVWMSIDGLRRRK